MRSGFTRLCSFFLAVVLMIMGLTSIAFATDEYVQKPTFWNWLNNQGGIFNGVVAYKAGFACPNTEDGYHRASSYYRTTRGGLYKCICDYCNADFNAYESDLDLSYQDQVSELPAQTYNSDGSLFIIPSHNRMYATYVGSRLFYYFLCEHCDSSFIETSSYFNHTHDCSDNSVVF